jgi:hypothetical protein
MTMQGRAQLLIFTVFIVALLFGSVVFIHNSLTAPYPGLNDFMSRWEGGRSYWVDGLNPYGEQASLNIQQRIYGRAVVEGEDPGYFAYPFYTLFVVWPLVYLDYAWASAVWLVLLSALLITALFLLLDLFKWRPKPWLLGLLLLWTLIFYFSSRGLILGQPGLVVYFLEVLAIWGLSKNQDRLAGVALALSTLKPQMGFLIVPFLLLWGLATRRWQFVGAFALAFGLLAAVSFILLPTWLSDWLAQLRLYTSYTALGSPVWIVTQYYLGLGTVGELLVNLLLYSFMVWAWYMALIAGKHERFLWTITLSLTVTHLTATRTATPHYVVFIIPLIFYLKLLTQHYRRQGGLWAALILMALLVIPWVHFVNTVAGEFEHPTVYLPLPFGMLLLLWLTRAQWWNSSPASQPLVTVSQTSKVQAG